MPSVNVSVYLANGEYNIYVERKKEINKLVRETVRNALKDQ